MKKNLRKAQSLIEYVIIVGVVITLFLATAQLFKRGVQSIVKTTSDFVGNQEASDQKWEENIVRKSGYLAWSDSFSDTQNLKVKKHFAGDIQYVFNDETTASTATDSILGFDGVVPADISVRSRDP